MDLIANPEGLVRECDLRTLAYPEGGFGGSNPPPKLFQSLDKAEPNSQFLGK
jgi:hypothetical protein